MGGSGKPRLSIGREEVGLDRRRGLSRRAAGGRDITVRPVVPGFERRLDEWREAHRLLRPTVTAVSVAAKATPGPTGVAAAHHLTRCVPAPAALAPQDRQPEPEPAPHRQLPGPLFRTVVHLVLLLRIKSVCPYPGPHL